VSKYRPPVERVYAGDEHRRVDLVYAGIDGKSEEL